MVEVKQVLANLQAAVEQKVGYAFWKEPVATVDELANLSDPPGTIRFVWQESSVYFKDTDGQWKPISAATAQYAENAKNADKLDGLDSNAFVKWSEVDADNDKTIDRAKQADFALDSDKLDGKDASDFAPATHQHSINDIIEKDEIMLKSQYDTNADGKVDAADRADRVVTIDGANGGTINGNITATGKIDAPEIQATFVHAEFVRITESRNDTGWEVDYYPDDAVVIRKLDIATGNVIAEPIKIYTDRVEVTKNLYVKGSIVYASEFGFLEQGAPANMKIDYYPNWGQDPVGGDHGPAIVFEVNDNAAVGIALNKRFLVGFDLCMARTTDGDLRWKRALVPWPDKLEINFASDFGYGVRINGPHVEVNGDIEFQSANQGVVLIDRATGQRYRLYVENGTLKLEAI